MNTVGFRRLPLRSQQGRDGVRTAERWWRAPWGPVAVLELSGEVEPGDDRALCEGVTRAVTTGHAFLVTCDVAAVAPTDLRLVDALAKAQLAAHRLDRTLYVQAPGEPLRRLLLLVGLDAVIVCCPRA